MRASLAVLLLAVAASGCGDRADLPLSAGYGPAPAVPEPSDPLVPTANVADAVGWPEGSGPEAAEGLVANAFATDLDHPRWLHVLPNGDVLVAETAAPPQPEAGGGIKGLIKKRLMKKAGAAVPSADRITLLRDADRDGVAEITTTLIDGLHSPFGMALVGSRLYVANTDAVLWFPYETGKTSIVAQGVKIADLPAGDYNQHWTRSLVASPDGSKLYVGVGSASNIAEYGMEEERGRAAIWELDLQTGAHREFATGLRNPVGLGFDPATSRLWAVVNERDELGSDVPPDYLVQPVEGGFYGWPYSYWGQYVDERVEPQRPELVASARVPDYGLGPHTAPLGLAFVDGEMLGPIFGEGIFVGQHGSWNRKPRSGYKVVFVPFADGAPSGLPRDVLTGFVSAEDEAFGRPAGVALAVDGALLVADDVGNSVWRVTPAP